MRLHESRRTIHQMLQDVTEKDPGAIAVSVIGDRDYSRAEVLRLATRFAGALQADGVQGGDRIVLIIGNRIDFVTAWCGSVLAGAVPVPFNTAFVGDVLENLLRASDPKVVVVDGDLLPSVSPVLSSLNFSKRVIATGAPSQKAGSNVVPFDAWLERCKATSITRNTPADVCTILYSSGTTGPSKGAIWPHNAIYSLADAFATLGKFGVGDRVYTPCPLFHGLGLIMGFVGSLMYGGACVVAPRFSLSRFWPEIIASQSTKTMLLSQMTTLVWQQEPSPLDRAHKVDAVFISPRPTDYFEQFEARFGWKVFGGLGPTDVGQPIRVGQGEGNPTSVGKEAHDWEVKLVDDLDEEVPIGQTGEMVARPRQPYIGTLGYFGMPEATTQLMRNCWYHTGDLLRRDKDGWYYFVDRKKDSMRRAGENISSFEVENALLAHPAVTGAAVFAVPAELGEDDVMASLLVREGASLEEIAMFVEARLPYYAVPRYFDIRTEFPLTHTQKVAKPKLKQDGVTPTTWDRGRTTRKR